MSKNSRKKQCFPIVPLSLAKQFEPLADYRKVSKVARGKQKSRISDGGFFQWAKKLKTVAKLKKKPIKRGSNQMWWDRRNQFCARHLAQQKKQKTSAFEIIDGYKIPTRRELGLIMWMCSSVSNAKLRSTIKDVKEFLKYKRKKTKTKTKRKK